MINQMFSEQPDARDFPGWPETKTRLARKPWNL